MPWAKGSGQYRMVGIPDGLGAHANGDGTTTLYMNSEFPSTTLSEPLVGGAKNRGAIVSKWILDADGDPIAGSRAYDLVFQENELVGPAPEVGNSTRPFSRFCSGGLAGPPHGFDRWIYLTNEEEGTPANTFDGKGGQTVAIVDNALYALPKLGRFAWENSLVQPNMGNRTVIMSMEDGPAAMDVGVENSQVYMYVGKKDHRAGAGVLRRNGLDNGELYVLVPADPRTRARPRSRAARSMSSGRSSRTPVISTRVSSRRRVTRRGRSGSRGPKTGRSTSATATSSCS